MIADEAQVPSYDLPDPLTFADGSRVTSAREWRVRRREILSLFAEHVYGVTPDLDVENEGANPEPLSAMYDGHVIRQQTNLKLRVNGGAIEIDLLAYRSTMADGPRPAIIVPNFRGNHTVDADPAIRLSERARRDHPELPSERGVMAHRFPVETITARGYHLVTFYYGDIVPDLDGLGDGVHPLFPAGSSGRSPIEWGAVGAWAWGMSRVLDHVLTDAGVDRDRVIVAGHSRLGKAALWAAAQDERFAAAFANNSGCTGAAICRRRFGETIAAINALFPHWFCRNYHAYAEREAELPVDQHELIAAIAPRPVYIASAADDLWADPRGEYLGARHASPVYQLLGCEGLAVEEWPTTESQVNPHPGPLPRAMRERERGGQSFAGKIGYHLRPGGHDLLADDWRKFLDFLEAAL